MIYHFSRKQVSGDPSCGGSAEVRCASHRDAAAQDPSNRDLQEAVRAVVFWAEQACKASKGTGKITLVFVREGATCVLPTTAAGCLLASWPAGPSLLHQLAQVCPCWLCRAANADPNLGRQIAPILQNNFPERLDRVLVGTSKAPAAAGTGQSGGKGNRRTGAGRKGRIELIAVSHRAFLGRCTPQARGSAWRGRPCSGCWTRTRARRSSPSLTSTSCCR